MQYLLLTMVILLNTAQSIVAKQYGVVARKSNTFFFSAISSFVAMFFFMLYSVSPQPQREATRYILNFCFPVKKQILSSEA